MIEVTFPLNIDVDHAPVHGDVGEVLAGPRHDIPYPEKPGFDECTSVQYLPEHGT